VTNAEEYSMRAVRLILLVCLSLELTIAISFARSGSSGSSSGHSKTIKMLVGTWKGSWQRAGRKFDYTITFTPDGRFTDVYKGDKGKGKYRIQYQVGHEFEVIVLRYERLTIKESTRDSGHEILRVTPNELVIGWSPGGELVLKEQ
jgi:hypothetical protein